MLPTRDKTRTSFPLFLSCRPTIVQRRTLKKQRPDFVHAGAWSYSRGACWRIRDGNASIKIFTSHKCWQTPKSQFQRSILQRKTTTTWNQAEDRPQLTRSWSTSINQLHGLRDNNALDNMFMSQAWHTGRLLSCNFHRCLPLRLRQQVETLSWPPIPLDGLGRC